MTQKNTSSLPIEIVGRDEELASIRACLQAGRNVLLEGPVGVGKTQLALAVTRNLGRPVYRVDGDSRYSEQKLAGWFDPPLVLQKGFGKDTFIPGPLIEAMTQGGILFINELNRLPEGVQNILLPAIDEKLVIVPRYGEVRAKEGFAVIATQNPKEFVATTHLSEAILDRFELVVVGYQGEAEEKQIVTLQAKGLTQLPPPDRTRLALASVRLVRATRDHRGIRRGASIRAALSISEIAAALIHGGLALEAAFLRAALLALPTRIELERDTENEADPFHQSEKIIREMAKAALDGAPEGAKKKA